MYTEQTEAIIKKHQNSISRLLLYHDLIDGIVAAMEARDPYTLNHSTRVAEMTERICKYMHLSHETTAIFHIAAHLHDLGKIGVDDIVLRKEGPLNNKEWKKMREHPVTGYNILMRIDSFADIADIVRHHHERWDGNGYPDGLSGKSIPLGARIIAVADSIDAMMTNRTYRKSMDSELSRAEIEKNTGIMYDPFVAAATLDHWNEIVFIKNRNKSNNST